MIISLILLTFIDAQLICQTTIKVPHDLLNLPISFQSLVFAHNISKVEITMSHLTHQLHQKSYSDGIIMHIHSP